MEPPKAQNKPWNSLLCQIAPKLKDKQYNINRAKISLQKYNEASNIDIVMFPQMSFTGYNFKDAEDAMPLAVQVGEGLEFQFARHEAKRLKSYVMFGYIEKQVVQGKSVMYNSAVIIDRKGDVHLNVRKTHLFYCDTLWCSEGSGFKATTLQNKKGDKFKCAVGICMDINEKDFKSGEFQWAEFIKKQQAQVLLFIANWSDNSTDSVADKDIEAMYNYWLWRIRPILNVKNKQLMPPKLFLVSDRVGTEYSFFEKKDVHFFGSSCAMMLNPPYVVGRLGKKDEGYLFVEGKLPK